MSIAKITQRYAKALLDFSIENQQADGVFNDMILINKTINQNEQLKHLLDSPVVKSEVKSQVLNQVFNQVSDSLKRMFVVLAENKRIAYIEQVAHSYITQYKTYKQEQIAFVTTAQPLSDSLKEQFERKIKELTQIDKIILENKIDSSIIGGFILRIGDLQYNASISGKLQNLKENLL